MGEQTNRAKVSVALIGVGPTWELYYREAVERLSARISVCAVCDSVQGRAEAIAGEFHAMAVASPWVLAQRKDLQAWLIFDPGWFGTYPAELSIEQGLPTLFANTFCTTPLKLGDLFRRSLDAGETLMPEFPYRFTPATIRLRELMATRLGRVRRIEVCVPSPSPSPLSSWLQDSLSECVGILDWCMDLVGHSVVSARIRTAAEGDQLHLNFSIRDEAHPDVPQAIIKRFPAAAESDIQFTVNCLNGTATLYGPMHIEWEMDSGRTVETLDHERSPQAIILDQFCRRALGGLVPAPSLNDALRGISAAQLALAELDM